MACVPTIISILPVLISVRIEALEASGSVQVKAAERLGLSERTLRYRMAKLGIK